MLTKSFSMGLTLGLARLRRGLIATACLLFAVAVVVFVHSAPAPTPAGDPCLPPGLLLLTDP